MPNSELSVAEVARVADCHPNTVRRYTERGWIRASRDINNFRRYELAETLKLKELLNTRVSEELMVQSRI